MCSEFDGSVSSFYTCCLAKLTEYLNTIQNLERGKKKIVKTSFYWPSLKAKTK